METKRPGGQLFKRSADNSRGNSGSPDQSKLRLTTPDLRNSSATRELVCKLRQFAFGTLLMRSASTEGGPAQRVQL